MTNLSSNETLNLNISDLLHEKFPQYVQPIDNAVCKDKTEENSTKKIEIIEKTVSAQTSPPPPPPPPPVPVIPKLWQNTKRRNDYKTGGFDYIAKKLDNSHVEYSIIHNNKIEKEIVDIQSSAIMDKSRKVMITSSGEMEFITTADQLNNISEEILIYPIPAQNETLPNDINLSVHAIFPVIPESLHIYKSYQNALRFLELIEYHPIDPIAVSVRIAATTNKSRRKIKLLAHNLAHLLATQTAIPLDVKEFFENYLKVLQFAENQQEIVAVSSVAVKRVEIINLTDYLLSTLNSSKIPRELSRHLDDLYDYLLVDLKNDDLNDFYPRTTDKVGFVIELFEYLQASNVVDDRIRNLIGMFRPFVEKNHNK